MFLIFDVRFFLLLEIGIHTLLSLRACSPNVDTLVLALAFDIARLGYLPRFPTPLEVAPRSCLMVSLALRLEIRSGPWRASGRPTLARSHSQASATERSFLDTRSLRLESVATLSA